MRLQRRYGADFSATSTRDPLDWMFVGKFRVAASRGRLVILAAIRDRDKSRASTSTNPNRALRVYPRISPMREELLNRSCFSRTIDKVAGCPSPLEGPSSRLGLYLELDGLKYRDDRCQGMRKGGEAHRSRQRSTARRDVSRKTVRRRGRICGRRLGARLRHSAAKLSRLYKRLPSGV